MIKNINKLLVLLSVFIIIFVSYVIFFFDPEDFKSEIQDYVSSKINYSFIYDGSLNLKYEPDARFSISGIRISDDSYNPPKRIVDIGFLELKINKEKIISKIIDVEKVEARNIVYFGTNIDEILMRTYSILKFKKFSAINPKNNTIVEKLHSSAIVSNDIMTVNELYLETQLLQSNGSGSIDLINKELKIDMIGKLKNIDNVEGVYKDYYPELLADKELPIIIRGPLDNPSIKIDMQGFIQKELINPLKDKLMEKIEDEIKDKIKLPF